MKQVVGKKVAASEGNGVDTGRASQHVADGAGSYFVQPIIEPIEVSIADVVMDEIVSSGPVDDFVYLDIGSVDRERKIFVEPKVISLTEAPSRAKQHVHAGDVLVSMTRPNLNAVAQVTQELHGSIASTGFYVLRSPWLEAGFLYCLVQTDSFVDAMCGVVQGALYPAVRPRDIDGFKFRLPPRVEQTRIVQKLEELLSDLDAGVAELKAAQRKLVQYRQSLLKAAVEGALTADWRAGRAQSGEPQETGAALLQRILTERRIRWETRQLAKFAEQGKTPPKDWKAKYPEPVAPDSNDLPPLPGGWLWTSVDQLSPDDLANGRSVPGAEVGARVLRLTSVKSGCIDLDECKIGRWSESEAKPFAVVKGDLLIVRGNGSLSLVGRAGLVPEVHEQVAYPDTMIRLRVIDSVVRTEWIGLLWDADVTRSHLERRARTSAGIYKISQPDIVSVRLPMPPVSEQDEILKLFAQNDEAMQSIEAMLEHALNQSAAQRKNILKAAFAGQLVPQDPNDEPASALLERIRAERAAEGEVKKPRERQSKETA